MQLFRDMEIISTALAAILLIVVTVLFRFAASIINTKVKHDSPRIPPGNFGLPWIGESGQFFNKFPHEFHNERKAKYGDIYRTHLFGSPTIIVSTPDAAKFVLATNNKSFKVIQAITIDKLLKNPVWEGNLQHFMRVHLLEKLNPEALKSKFPDISRLARLTLSSWPKTKAVIIHKETRKFSFHVMLAITCSIMPCPESLQLLDDYTCLAKGAYAIPINLPGTTFYSAMKRQKAILKFLMQVIHKREADSMKKDDILGCLLESRDANGQKLSLGQIQDLLLSLLFVGHETTTMLLLWIVKYLTENPQILQKVQDEQQHIRESDEPFCLDRIARMTYTTKVFYETLRLANVAPFVMREVTEDVEYKGYLFPKGHKVHVYSQYFHLDAQFYPEPSKFDPSRFEKPATSYVYSPFGNGPRHCVASVLVKIQTLIFIHHLTTTYRWEAINQDKGIHYWLPSPKDGYPILVNQIGKDD